MEILDNRMNCEEHRLSGLEDKARALGYNFKIFYSHSEY